MNSTAAPSSAVRAPRVDDASSNLENVEIAAVLAPVLRRVRSRLRGQLSFRVSRKGNAYLSANTANLSSRQKGLAGEAVVCVGHKVGHSTVLGVDAVTIVVAMGVREARALVAGQR